jgi:hypothetical protein
MHVSGGGMRREDEKASSCPGSVEERRIQVVSSSGVV